jgi:hypothetical protein
VYPAKNCQSLNTKYPGSAGIRAARFVAWRSLRLSKVSPRINNLACTRLLTIITVSSTTALLRLEVEDGSGEGSWFFLFFPLLRFLKTFYVSDLVVHLFVGCVKKVCLTDPAALRFSNASRPLCRHHF